MTDKQVNALAAFLAEGRDDWQAPGIVAELRRQRDHYDPWQLAAAMCKRASDPKNTSPQLQAFDGQGFVGCRRHPTAGTRTDGRCGTCYAEAREAPSSAIRDRGGVAPSPEARALILAAVTHGPRRRTHDARECREQGVAGRSHVRRDVAYRAREHARVRSRNGEGSPMTNEPTSAATPEQWRAAYQAKIDDLARETLRASALAAVVRRLYAALASEWNGQKLPQGPRHDFFDHGFPPDERAALLAALEPAEVEWINDDHA